MGFLVLAVFNYRFRKTIPKQIERAKKAAAFQSEDVGQLRPIFDHFLWVEIVAFILTAVAALVSAFSS